MSTPIRVLIVDDQALFREGLHTLLSVQTDLQIVGEARNGEEALRLSPYGPSSSQPLLEPLSERELEILRLLGQGASNKEIADHLIITVGTVKNHLTSIMGKLGVRDRTQAALKARELAII